MDVLRAMVGIYDYNMVLEVQLLANPNMFLPLRFKNDIAALFDRVHHAYRKLDLWPQCVIHSIILVS